MQIRKSLKDDSTELRDACGDVSSFATNSYILHMMKRLDEAIKAILDERR